MNCAECDWANDADGRFCTQCGAALVAVCPLCSTTNRAGSKFCGDCGTALATGSISSVALSTRSQARTSAETPSQAQRRTVSVAFADLVGFTTISQHRDAEETRDLLTRYFDTARVAVERHGGVVEKFIGDAVMAVWGSTTAHEDDAERAVRAALELVDAVKALGSQLGVDLAARAGVLTGVVAVTVGASEQGLIAGDLVNTSSRVQAAAEPDTVLVGEATFHASSGAIAFEPRGEISVKGRDEPVAIWRALRVVGERGGGARSGRPEPPFVSRKEELRVIKELLHVTERERRARLISITGIAGIGKSRLAWEFRKYIDGLTENVFWHQGRCPAYGEGVTFWALGEMVRMRAGIAETDEPDETRRKLADMLQSYLPDADERHWVEPRLAHLLGLGDATPGDREELFSAWRSLFERVAEHGVTTLVFEDLHWADSGLLDFIESILEWSRNSPIVVITLARPELLDRRPTWGARLRNYTALHLDALGDQSMHELVCGFVTGLSAEDALRITARAEGVPLYAVETIRMLAERGVLSTRGDSYTVTDDTGDIGTLDVPGSLHALIAARLDVLSADEADLLRDATVLGTSFTVDSLATVRGEPAAEVESRLRELGRKEFLTQEADPRSPERGQYTFLQGIIREVAYGTLSKADLRHKHLAVARYMESGGDDEMAGVIASHYVEALRATPEGPDADAISTMMRKWVSAAATRALSLGSPEQALAYVEQALDLAPEQEQAALLELAGDAASSAGQTDRAVRYLERAAVLYRDNGDQVAAAHVTALLVHPMGALDRRSEAQQLLERALADLPADADLRARAELLTQLSLSMRFSTQLVKALGAIEEAMVAVESLDADDLLIDALQEKSQVLFALGRHREALILARGAVDLAGTAGTRKDRAVALMCLGVMVAENGPRESYEACMAAVEASRAAGTRTVEQLSLANGLESAIDLGLFTEAETILAELASRGDTAFLRSGLSFNAAVLAAYRGERTEAAKQLAEVEERLTIDDRMSAEHAWHLRAKSLVELLEGDVEQSYEDGVAAVAVEPAGMNAPTTLSGCAHAAAWLRDAMRLRHTIDALQTFHGPWITNLAGGARASLAAVEGRTDEAAAGFRQVLDEWTHMDLPLDYAWSVLDALAVLPRDAV
ncbi:MAG: adenylate/guanylate cyclase domain-containing protein, partial [Candidatus Nanopelagicales bacterium]